VVSSVGNSVIYNPNAFDWGTSVRPVYPQKDLVIYQMHIGTFEGGAPPRTFDHGITRLDHVKRLGANVIKLMPVHEFSGNYSWGYNPSDQFSVESSYGGPDAMKRFVKACHERGITVFYDVVHNHYGPTEMDLWQFDGWSLNNLGGIYFYNDNRAYTDWGNTRPDFGRPEVYEFIRDQIFMLTQEYRAGGFRWDSVYNIINNYSTSSGFLGANTQGQDLLRRINGELMTNFPDVVRGAEDHAFDYPMNFQYVWDVGWRWNLHGQVTQSADANRNMATVKNLYDGWPGLQHVVFSEAHDYVGQLNGRTRLPSEIDSANPTSIWAVKRGLLAGSVVMTTPGIPMIFMGQEMHETLQWHDNVPLRWTLTNTHAGIVRAYTDLIHARRNLRGATQGLEGNGVVVHHVDNTSKVVGFIRWDAGGQTDDVVGVANFSGTRFTNNNYQIEFPSAGTWYCHFNGDSKSYATNFDGIGGVDLVATGAPAVASVNMGMYSMQLFSKTAPTNFAAVPSSVAFNPGTPTGCVPVTITYNAGTGPLMNAPQVNIYLGRNGWLDPTNLPMVSLGSNRWQYSHQIQPDTFELNMVFNDGTVWDNNSNLNWAVSASGCVSAPSTNPASLAIATAVQSITVGTTSSVINVQILDASEQITTATSDVPVQLSSSQPGSFLPASGNMAISSVTISNGQSSAAFRYASSSLGAHLITVSNAMLGVDTQALDVVSAALPFDLLVYGNQQPIQDGNGSASSTNGTYFGDLNVGQELVRTFTVTNTGTSAIGLGPVQISGSTNFTVTTPLPAQLSAGRATNFAVRFAPGAEGSHFATVSFTNQSATKSPYDFAVGGFGTRPSLDLSRTAIVVSVKLGNTPADQTFEVLNHGSGLMNYTATVNQAWISVDPTNGVLNIATSRTHTVRFNAGGLVAGVYTGRVQVSAAFATNAPKFIAVTLTIDAPSPATDLYFVTPPRTVLAGAISAELTVGLKDASGTPTLSAGSNVIDLASDKAGFFISPTSTNRITSIVISNGSASASFRYQSSSAGSHLISVTNRSGTLTSTSQTLVVNSSVTDVFTNSTTFTVPPGVTQLVVEAWGGGGGALRNGTTRRPGGGGGAYARSSLAVIPGAVFNVVVGAGGASGNPGQPGGDSSFGNSSGTNLLAKGGGGASGTSTVGAGGSANTSISLDGVRFAGGAGGARGPSGGGGGGGGGSAFMNSTGLVGSAGTSTNGGAGGAGTGAGGNGGAPGVAGQSGIAPGGGGGGNGNGNGTSGAGARGQVQVSYLLVKAGTASFNPPAPSGCGNVTITYAIGDGPLLGATNIQLYIGINGWSNAADRVMTNQGGGTWVTTLPVELGTFEWNLAFNNGSGTWDNNGGVNWSLPITNCLVRPSIVTMDPAFPQGCQNLTIVYEENGGMLAGAAQMNVLIGHNSWLYEVTRPLTNAGAGIWSVVYPIPEGTIQLELVFNNGAGMWDNNSMQNWPVYVSGCYLADGFSLAITNPLSDIQVPYTNTAFAVRGAASRIAGMLSWTNTKTGAAGKVPAGNTWQLPETALEIGPNLFSVTGSNSTENLNHGARDSATNAVYGGGWTNGMNGGVRWGGGWELSASGSAGHFNAATNEPNLVVGPRAWAMWANTNQNGFAEARRPFADRLHAGDVLSFKFQNNWIQNGSSVGFGLKNYYNENLFEFLFVGGATNYTVNDGLGNGRNTGIGWTGSGLNLSFELTSPTTYRLQANTSVVTGQLASATELMAREFRVWNFSAGPGGNYNFYFTDLSVTGAPLESAVYTAERLIYRKYGPTFSAAPKSGPARLGITFPSTEIGYIYEVYGATNLAEPDWLLLGNGYYGDGQPLEFDVTNDVGHFYIRTSVRPVQ